VGRQPDGPCLRQDQFRQQIQDRAVSLLFARDGVEALAALKANGQIDLVVTDRDLARYRPELPNRVILQYERDAECRPAR
jgi:CheY-like chemotaxis protein